MAIFAMNELTYAGHVVTSRWLKAGHEMGAKEDRVFALEDLDDVATASVLLAINPPGWEEKGTGGRHVELGYALARGKRVILMGKRSNVFHALVDEVIDTLGEVLARLNVGV